MLLLSIDENWKEHLRELDQLRQSVQNASYEQKDPLVIYKVESFKLFQTMLGVLNTKVVATLLRGQIPVEASDPDSVRREGERAPERTRPQQRFSCVPGWAQDRHFTGKISGLAGKAGCGKFSHLGLAISLSL